MPRLSTQLGGALDVEEIGRWLRLAGALHRFGEYVQAQAGHAEDYIGGLEQVGLASTVDRFAKQARALAERAELGDEYAALFSPRRDLDGTAKLASTLATLVALTGWVAGQVDALTIEGRIQAEAEALAAEKTRRVGFHPGE